MCDHPEVPRLDDARHQLMSESVLVIVFTIWRSALHTIFSRRRPGRTAGVGGGVAQGADPSRPRDESPPTVRRPDKAVASRASFPLPSSARPTRLVVPRNPRGDSSFMCSEDGTLRLPDIHQDRSLPTRSRTASFGA